MTATPWCKTPSGARSLLVSLIAILLTLPAIAQTQTPIFPVLPYNFALSPQPNMALGDFNGDGRIDEATSNGINAMGISLNNGPTSSPTLTSIPLSCTPQYVLASDLNNDTKLDLAFSCGGGYIGVLLGNGDGTFQPASYYAVTIPGAAAPILTQVIAIDLNGDGYLDIAVIANSDEVGVLLNQGSGKPGSLSSSVLYSAPTNVTFRFIGAGDFNGDGKQDIIAGNAQLAVYYGKGDGTLNSPQLITASVATNSIGQSFVTGDFNRDGLADVAYLSSDPQSQDPSAPAISLQILLGDPSKNFTTGATLALNPSMNYAQIVPFQNTTTSSVTNFALVGGVTSIAINDGNGGLSMGESYSLSTYAVALSGANGNINLYFQSNVESVTAVGNGNGTFQASPATVLPYASTSTQQIGTPITADLNGDGLTDVLGVDFGGNLIAALGRGNGRFAVTTQNTGSTQPPQYIKNPPVIVTGDFDGDGKPDAIIILPGSLDSHGEVITANAQMFFYSGNGDGTFKASPAPAALSFYGAGTPAVGDFNGDGKLDLLVPYGGLDAHENPAFPTGTFFFAGKGDGTFAAPIAVSAPPVGYDQSTLGQVVDVNNDGKLDIIGGNTLSLGNGDGTFQEQPWPTGGVVTSDLNGDGIPDLLAGGGIYAGNGDGTFQTTPFFTKAGFGTAVGDLNGDGHLDLLNPATGGLNSSVTIYFGDGKGNFTADPNTYPVNVGPLGQLARLNNQAPNLPGDNKLDYLSFSGQAYSLGQAVYSLLNQLNPASTPPALLPSKTTLAASANSAAPGQQLTFTATVTGATPTGTVSFASNGKALGTASIINGSATLATSFATASTYPVIANYAGDTNNTSSSSNAVSIVVAPVSSTTTLSVSAASAGTNQQLTLTASVSGLNPTGTVTFASATAILGTAPVTNGVAVLPFTFTAAGIYTVTASYAGDIANLSSVSAPVTVTIPAPDYTVTASPSSATIKAGQSATTTLTVTPVGGYTGTVKFSCGTLPTGVTCNFAPSSITPSTGSATSTLTITTTAPPTAFLRNLSGPLQGIAWASLLFLTLTPRRIFRLNRRLARASLLTLLLAAGLLSFSGCSSSSPSNPPTNPGTPVGVQTVTLTTTDSSGNLSHAINFQVTVQ
ncbi:FG-GAP-like repeat-containing protein [Tunturiibacter empetritectus]|uniref:Bacterial Ig-like domain-containing protein n=1 Tax=Tunturiibacter lichenicola TaxID=2051959 RepID=A0A852VHG9_9BACT|nr:FG-GAP-like repeat-containing protein [Edaphobacter lichenicola]NYF88946.1 hypothetical protein [Edaphobacter lichenicola]